MISYKELNKNQHLEENRVQNKLSFLVILMIVSLNTYSSEESEKERYCFFKSKNSVDKLQNEIGKSNCERGDIISWVDGKGMVSGTVDARVCNFNQEIVSTGTQMHGFRSCRYIGYVRTEVK